MTEARSPGGAGRPAKAEAHLKVLIIDPNPNHRDRLKDMVRELEFVESVSDRGSPSGVLDLLVQNPVHVLMIDRNPGAGDVYEIVKAVRAKAAGTPLRFVMIGDRIDEETRAKGGASGISAFLQRPYDLAAVEKVLTPLAGAIAEAIAKATAKAAAPPRDPAKEAAQAKAMEALRDTLDKLRKVSLFAGFTDQDLVRLLKICRTRQFPAGGYVFREGDKATSLYVLVAGKLEIRTGEGDAERVLVEMHPGDCFGEISIIDANPRSADAKAATDCTVIEVSESVVNSNNDLLSLKLVRQIAILLAKKLRQQSHPASR